MTLDPWQHLERHAPETALVDGVEVTRGTRVRLRPRPGREIWDRALDGRTATVERIDEDVDGNLHAVVVVDDDPGRELGVARPGSAFFFSIDELEPLQTARVLVAGIGNVFLGDDGFGCEVAARLAREQLPDGAEVGDFGIRGMDLAYALRDYDAAILVDATPRGEPSGTVSVIEPVLDDDEVVVDTHGMDPVRVLRLARELGGVPARTLVVGCEPALIHDPERDDVLVELSEPVRAAVETAVRIVRSLVDDLLEEQREKGGER